MNAFIRPVYRKSDDVLIGLCLARVNTPPLVDEDIIEHFDKHESGKFIRQVAEEMGFTSVEWGSPLCV